MENKRRKNSQPLTDKTERKHRHPNSLKNLIPFEPGESGNPDGRPPGVSLTATVRRILEERPNGTDEKTYLEHISKRAVLNAMAGKEKTLEMIWERVDGKVTDHLITEHTGSIATLPLSGKVNKKAASAVRQMLYAKLKEERKRADG